ncbi:MAG TPA: hypothetical protein VIY27_13215 [Myxococcota bacterium]
MRAPGTDADACDRARAGTPGSTGADDEHPPGAGDRRVRFGDVVLLSDGSLGVVYLPDQGAELMACFELDELGNLPEQPRDRETLIASRDSIARVVRSHADLPGEIQRRLEPYRRGILLGESHWIQGVELLDAWDRACFENGLWDELDRDAHDFVVSLFGPFSSAWGGRTDPACYRVLVHLDEAWDSWRCFGPMTRGESRALVESLPSAFARPRPLRPGVYQTSTEAMSKLEVYRRYTKIEELRFTRGQGEADDPSAEVGFAR